MRAQDIYGHLGEGETCLYSVGSEGQGQARVSLKGDGSVTLFTTEDNTKTGAGTYLKLAPDGLTFHASFGTIVFDKTGFHVLHESGVTFDLGGLADPTSPNYAVLSACNVTVDSPVVMLGPSAARGGSGVYMGGVIAPIASPEEGTPVPVAAGLGVSLGITSTKVFLGG
jgi:hypothetical protein